MTSVSTGSIDDYEPSSLTLAARYVGWTLVAALFAFLGNAYLDFWQDWPGAVMALDGGSAFAWVQLLLYVVAVAAPIPFVLATRSRSLRRDSLVMTAIAAQIARAAFWAVLLVGVADTVISFTRVEGLLESFVGAQLTQDLGRNPFRGPYVHLPLILAGVLISIRARGLGFPWLTVMVVLAELMIVISRFVFSYEQAFMADLVRFWYGGLFLFASAHTLLEDGHVRVDVLYAAFTTRAKGMVNAVGSLLLGAPLCCVILVIGFGQKSSIIASPLLALEVTQQGFGMYVKYLLASFLAIFATTMLIQFAGYFLDSVADVRGDPGGRQLDSEQLH